MRKYVAMYKGKTIEVEAASTYEAQKIAAGIFKAKKSHSVWIMQSAVEHSPSILPGS